MSLLEPEAAAGRRELARQGLWRDATLTIQSCWTRSLLSCVDADLACSSIQCIGVCSRRNGAGVGSGQGRKRDKCGAKIAFVWSFRVHAVCRDDVKQWRGHDATMWGVDRVKVEKVTDAVRPSGGTPKLAFVRCGRVHAVSLEDVRQWRSRDATVLGLVQVRVEKVTNAARPSGGTPKLAFMRCSRVHAVCLDVARQGRVHDATV
jgi:hypothetical protein